MSEKKGRVERIKGAWQIFRLTPYDYCDGCKTDNDRVYEVGRPFGGSGCIWRYLCDKCCASRGLSVQDAPTGPASV